MNSAAPNSGTNTNGKRGGLDELCMQHPILIQTSVEKQGVPLSWCWSDRTVVLLPEAEVVACMQPMETVDLVHSQRAQLMAFG